MLRKIRPYCEVYAFADKNPLQEEFEGTPIFSLDCLELDTNCLIVVVPTYDFDIIRDNLLRTNKDLKAENILRFEDFVNMGRKIEPCF